MIDLRERLGPVRDQGERATCLSLAMSDGQRGATSGAPVLSADFLHFHATRAAGVSINDAVTVSVAKDALEYHGQPAEQACPYSMIPRPLTWEPPTECGSVWRHTTSVAQTDLFRSIASQIEAGKPVLMVLQIDDAFWDVDDGLVAVPRDPPRALHAVLAVAHAIESQNVLVRNTWGPDWGDEGHAWLSSAYIGIRCSSIVVFEGRVQ